MEKENASLAKGTEGSSRNKGYTLVELITVLAIMAILGTMLMSMLNIGVKFYRTANSKMENQNNARLAVAYITVKIRQNDVANGISVVPTTTGSSIYVLKIKNAGKPSENTFFWIYFQGGKLLEQRGTAFDPDTINDTEIADLSSVIFEQPGANIIHFEVTSLDGTYLTQDITLRASP